MSSNFNSPEGNLEEHFVDEYFLIDQYIGDTLSIWGYGAYGQLGINDTTHRSTPVTTFAGGTNWKQVSTGVVHSAAIKTDGTLWTWGYNAQGQLGINDTTQRDTPVTTFAGGTNWKQICSGTYNCAAIKTDGTLWTWGNNSYAQLGINDGGNRNTPVTTFAGGTNWKQVSIGENHTVAVKTDGTLWNWGQGIHGALGTNDMTDRSTPVTTFAGGTNWKQACVGTRFYTMGLKSDGTLWTWGSSPYGGMGDSNTSQTARSFPNTVFGGHSNWKSVSAGGFLYGTTAAIKTDGTLWIWGIGQSGELGINDTVNWTKNTPVTTFAGGTNWKSVSIGHGDGINASVRAIKTDGTLWTWGNNGNGQLGTNDTAIRCTPVTTFAGGTNWKQVSNGMGGVHCAAITSGTDPTFFVS